MNPPRHVVVVFIDETSQIKALDETQTMFADELGKCAYARKPRRGS